MNVLKIVLLSVFLTGCADVKPYIEIGLSTEISRSTDYWIHSDRSWQCEPPQFDGEIGLEHKSGISLGLHHESMVLCGSWNHKPEIYGNSIRLSGRWGGY